jgi:hypothetical protein
MVHSAGDLMVALMNLGPGVRRVSSCACPGAVSRVVALELLLGRRPYDRSRVWLPGGSSGYTVTGVAASHQLGFPQCWG